MNWTNVFGFWEVFRAKEKKKLRVFPPKQEPLTAAAELQSTMGRWRGGVPNDELRRIMQLSDCDQKMLLRCITASADQQELLQWIAWQGWYLTLREWFAVQTIVAEEEEDQTNEVNLFASVIPTHLLKLCRETLDEHDANKASIVAYCEDQLDWTMARKYVQKWGMTSSAAVKLLALLYMHGQISLQPQAVDAPEDLVTS